MKEIKGKIFLGMELMRGGQLSELILTKKKQKKEKSSGSAQIWFPHVFHQFLSSDNVVIQNCNMGPPLPKIEQSRMLKADHLRRSLTKMRKVYFDRNIEREMQETGNNDLKSRRKMKPAVMAVERWFMQNGLKFPSSAPENFKRDAAEKRNLKVEIKDSTTSPVCN